MNKKRKSRLAFTWLPAFAVMFSLSIPFAGSIGNLTGGVVGAQDVYAAGGNMGRITIPMHSDEYMILNEEKIDWLSGFFVAAVYYDRSITEDDSLWEYGTYLYDLDNDGNNDLWIREDDKGIYLTRVETTNLKGRKYTVELSDNAKDTSEIYENYYYDSVTFDFTPLVLFDDVKDSGKYYFDPVYWAVDNGITTGTSAKTFSPGNPCTRAQIVTFLWHAEGDPEPASGKNPFKDVSSSSYYYKAVLWAVEKGITTGTSAATFSPGNPCTRAQSVTFLYNAMGKPANYADINFKDVKSGSYYYDAVRWAVKERVTAGVSATEFGSDRTCTRAQIVTFLYNAYSHVPVG